MRTFEDQFDGLFGVSASSVGNQISVQPVALEQKEGVGIGRVVVVLAAITVGVIAVVKIVNYFEEQEGLKNKRHVL
jgi:hypothetical protein